jgi:uncharacterized protein (DUF779 family)
LLDRLQTALGEGTPLAFFISGGGCCGGTSPVLCHGETVVPDFDVGRGQAGSVPVFAHPEHARQHARDRFVVDALDDPRSDTFSLETAHGGRLVLRELEGAPG